MVMEREFIVTVNKFWVLTKYQELSYLERNTEVFRHPLL